MYFIVASENMISQVSNDDRTNVLSKVLKRVWRLGASVENLLHVKVKTCDSVSKELKVNRPNRVIKAFYQINNMFEGKNYIEIKKQLNKYKNMNLEKT